MDIISRAEWGARPPSGGRNRINAKPLGTAVHWHGPSCADHVRDHEDCAPFVRGVQDFHLDGRGWSDVAYSDLACPHGCLFEGRGRDVGTAANGTNYGNANYYAVMLMWGEGDGTPPDAMLDAAVDAVALHRTWGAGDEVTTHRALYSTECPGDEIAGMVAAGRFDGGRGGGAQSVDFEVPKPRSEPKERYWTPTAKGYTTADVQRIVDVTVDNLYGPATMAAVRKLQERLGVTADGYFGPATAAAFEASKRKPKRKPKGKRAPKFPLPRGHWYGVESSDPRNHSGYWKRDRAGIEKWQQRMRDRGWTIGVDGRFGPQSESVARSFQREKGLSVDGCVGDDTWAAAWTEPVT